MQVVKERGLEAPFPWFGGKRKIASEVWARFGDVENYVEPFFGSGAVLLARPTPRGNETINDLDGFVANFWRAVQRDPEAVAEWADNPVNENDLHARHSWLVRHHAGSLQPKLDGDPDFFDAKIAGWWVWGISCWIGSGFCSGRGPWVVDEDRQLVHLGNNGQGVNRQLVHLGNNGQGVNRKLVNLGNNGQGVNRQLVHLGDNGRGVNRQRVHLGNNGRGVNRQRVHLGNNGRGVNRQLVHLGNNGQGVNRQLVHLGNNGRGRLVPWFSALADRLKRVRVCSGDWARVCGPSVTFKHGITGVLLDPPYADTAERASDLYREDSESVAHSVREWAIENGKRRDMRIALCGYEGEHDMPGDWSVHSWNAGEGFGVQADERTENGKRERIWFSPACESAAQRSLFDRLVGDE